MRNQAKFVPDKKKRKKRKNISQKELYRRLYKIYRVLQSDKCGVVFERLRGAWGEYEPSANNGLNAIKINPHRREFFNTIIHECLHAINYNMPHYKVYWLAGQIVKKMSSAQYAHLVIALTRGLEKYYSLKVKKEIKKS